MVNPPGGGADLPGIVPESDAAASAAAATSPAEGVREETVAVAPAAPADVPTKAAPPEIYRDRLRQRLKLEMDCRATVLRLILLLVQLITFLYLAQMLLPPEQASAVHRHLEGALALQRVDAVKTPDDVYTFMSELADRHAKLQPTDSRRWCEERFYSLVWDPATAAPMPVCTAPALIPLETSTLMAISPSARRLEDWQDGSTESQSDSDDYSSESSSENDFFRWLQADSNDTNDTERDYYDYVSEDNNLFASLVPTAAPTMAGPCKDHDETLSIRLNRNTTCNETAPDVCSTDVAYSLCSYTCDLCGPYRYKRISKFSGPLITVLPMLVYQQRHPTTYCSGFGARYEEQAPNPSNFFQPVLDGKRSSRLTTCIDRSTVLTSQYALEVECPADGSGGSSCVNGKYYDTRKETFRKETVYPKVLTQPLRDIARMQAVQWLDAQTGSVSMAMLAYTEGLELFTFLSVKFIIDEAGNIEPVVEFKSWKDLLDSEVLPYQICAGVVCGFAFLGILHSLYVLYGEPQLTGGLAWEFFSRLFMLLLSGGLLMWKPSREHVSIEFSQALQDYMSISDLSGDAGKKLAMAAFVKAADRLLRLDWELEYAHVFTALAISSNLVLFLIYMHAHPRTAVLSATFQKAMGRLAYLFVIMIPTFLFFGFIGFWMFGFELDNFATYGEALEAQLQMLYGHFVRAPGAEALGDVDATMYWIYAVLFMVGVFLLLRFVFLAVVIDAFLEMKAERPVVARNAPYDALDSLRAWLRSKRRRWPSATKICKYLREEDTPLLLTNESLAEGLEMDAGKAQDLLKYYTDKFPEMVKPKKMTEEQQRTAAQAEMDALEPLIIYPKLDPERVAKRVVHEVTYRLAERDPRDVDRFVTIGRLARVISREFQACGLIKG
eukprot:TRINITY_DN29026_c0_g1_i1.p1 TRINITY_DN29026_c0_g1~~TRINITY_DN29026_c0_g1_i1.p1  ORF type:complete len:894 (-),score=159.45 TRINITY_DN29026_c0_g1_i1:482-3163(-)